jgi:antitoxin component YwqK of YwqJK toxin-antitoxin module
MQCKTFAFDRTQGEAMKITQKNVTIITDTHPNGQLHYRQFRVDDRLHRLDGPACESWHQNGQLYTRQFYVEGKFHRLDGPAREYWNENGQLSYREFWVDGKRHRLDGPAAEYWFEDGQLRYQEFWVDGKQVAELPAVKTVPTCDGRTIEIDGKKYILTLQD